VTKAEIIHTAEYLNTKYTEDQFLNIVKNHERNQPNKNSAIKTAEKVVEELNKSKTVTQIWKACNKQEQD
jgi:HEPN domain-containing protein